MLQRMNAIAAGCVFAALTAVGCSSHSGGPDGGPEVVQAGYPVDDTYYNQGAYEGDYWVWHDRDGHSYREGRADHEQRASVRSEGNRGQNQQRDVQNQRGDVRQRQDASKSNPGPAQAGGRNEVQPGARNDAHGMTQSHGTAADGRGATESHGEAGGGHEGDNGEHR